MRPRHVVAVVAIVLVGVGVKLTQLRSVRAQYVDGARVSSSSTSHEEIQDAKSLPVQKVQDATHVFVSDNLAGDGVASVTPQEPRKGWFTPRCAERDLRAGAVIEEFGQIDAMPPAWLAAAGLNWLQARSYCLTGAENEAVALYDRIIAGDVRLASDWAMK